MLLLNVDESLNDTCHLWLAISVWIVLQVFLCNLLFSFSCKSLIFVPTGEYISVSYSIVTISYQPFCFWAFH
jgi:hypothetical protein